MLMERKEGMGKFLLLSFDKENRLKVICNSFIHLKYGFKRVREKDVID